MPEYKGMTTKTHNLDPFKDAIISAYNSGTSLIALGIQYGCSKSTIFTNLVGWQAYKRKSGNYTLNHHYFDVINTAEKAYWLGFIAADGTVQCHDGRYNLRLGVKESDGCVIDAFKTAVGYNGPNMKDAKTMTDGRVFPAARVKISSKIFVPALVEKGVVERKTYSLRFPSACISNALVSHFVRGYFDGDGNFWKGSFRFVGCPDFMRDLEKIFAHDIGITCLFKQTKGFAARLHCHSGFKFYQWLYKDATAYMPRKKLAADLYYAKRVKDALVISPDQSPSSQHNMVPTQ